MVGIFSNKNNDNNNGCSNHSIQELNITTLIVGSSSTTTTTCAETNNTVLGIFVSPVSLLSLYKVWSTVYISIANYWPNAKYLGEKSREFKVAAKVMVGLIPHFLMTT